MIEAKIICDSIAEHSPRLTTFQLRYPKFIHGEFMTHRMFSRNASSSRAIPVAKNIREVKSDILRAAPEFWGCEQKGMQSGEELSDELSMFGHKVKKEEWKFSGRGGIAASSITSIKRQAWEDWKYSALLVVERAENLCKLGVHKSIVNRLLEPFLHINVVASSCKSGLLNFFGLRLDKATQPEIRVLAEKMWAAWQESEPKKLEPGEWHLPFVEGLDEAICCERSDFSYDEYAKQELIKVSVARCARVSYLSHETGKRSTIEEDLALYNRLVGSQPLHASPAEHQATPDNQVRHLEQHGNLPGWIQYRKLLPNESIAPLPPGYSF